MLDTDYELKKRIKKNQGGDATQKQDEKNRNKAGCRGKKQAKQDKNTQYQAKIGKVHSRIPPHVRLHPVQTIFLYLKKPQERQSIFQKFYSEKYQSY
jgi:hypothetical protein